MGVTGRYPAKRDGRSDFPARGISNPENTGKMILSHEVRVKNITKKTVILLLANMLITAVVTGWAVFASRGLPKLNYSAEDWKTDNLVYRDDAFFVDGETENSGRKSDFFWGPFTNMKAGSYTAFIEYSAETDQECYADAYGQSPLMISSAGILSRYLHSLSYQFEVTQDIDKFDLRIPYNGSGEFSIRSISVVSNNNRIKRTAAGILALTALADFALVFSGFSEERKKTVLMLAGTAAVVSIPLAMPGIPHGHDLEFHCLRIEALVQALRSGQFPVRFSTFPLYGLGYPLSVFYNDIFLYFPALLRMLGFGVTSAYKIYLLSVNVLTVILSYFCFRKLFRSENTALLLTLLYASSAYRLVNLYVRAAAGEYTAQAFLPLLGLAFYNIYAEETTARRKMAENGLLLAAGPTGFIASHIPIVIMSLFIMVLVCLCLFRKTFRQQTLLTLCAAAVLTVLLNLYYIVPFLDYYLHVPTNISGLVQNGLNIIQQRGAYPAQFFAFFRNVSGDSGNEITERLMLTPGLPLMGLFLWELGRFFSGKKLPGVRRFYLLFAALTLWLSTNLFPWNLFTFRVPFWRYLSQIEFPWRFLTIAVLFLTLLGGEMLRGSGSRSIRGGLAAAAVLSAVLFAGRLFDQSSITDDIYDASGVKHSLYTEDYFIQGSVPAKMDTEVRSENMADVRILSRDASKLRLFCSAGSAEGPHFVTVPLYNYKEFRVLDDDGHAVEIRNGVQNRISFELPDGFEGNLNIAFRTPSSWTAALLVSLLTAAGICLYLLACRRKTHKAEREQEKSATIVA